MEPEIKVTNDVQFGFPVGDTLTAIKVYGNIADLVEGLTLEDIDLENALLMVKEVSDGVYEVRPQGCRITNYSKRTHTQGPFPVERCYEEFDGGVRLARKGVIALPIGVTIYFNPEQ